MNRSQLSAWWAYRLRAKGRHGVHSPFVYRLVEECLLRRNSQPLEQRIAHHFSEWNLQQAELGEALHLLQQRPYERAVFLLQGIHQSPQAAQQWHTLCAHEMVTLSVDIFRYGLLFFHPDFIVRQHFILKALP